MILGFETDGGGEGVCVDEIDLDEKDEALGK